MIHRIRLRASSRTRDIEHDDDDDWLPGRLLAPTLAGAIEIETKSLGGAPDGCPAPVEIVVGSDEKLLRKTRRGPRVDGRFLNGFSLLSLSIFLYYRFFPVVGCGGVRWYGGEK